MIEKSLMMEGECKMSTAEEKKKETGLPEVTKLDKEEGELTDESAEEATGDVSTST